MNDRKSAKILKTVKKILANFVDIDDVISLSGRQPMWTPETVKPVPRFTAPQPGISPRDRPDWRDTVRIGYAEWSMADLDEVDCEYIEWPGSGIKFYHGVFYYNFMAACRIVKQLDGWHIPTLGEWASAREYSVPSGMLHFRMPAEYDPSDTALRIRRMTETLAMLPLGQFNRAIRHDGKPVDFGAYAYYWTGDGHIIAFSNSLSVMRLDLNEQDPDRIYTPIRLVKNSNNKE